MKLFYSKTSPYVRKVMACAIACGVDGQLETLTTDPWASPADLLAQNPLSKVPCLVTEDGVALFDSPVICEYIDYLGRGSLFPPAGAPRWRALKQQAIADGILDASIMLRQDSLRPQEDARTAVMTRQRQIVARGLDALEAEPPADHVDIGTISIACALGYLDFRFADDAWRTTRPTLSAWYERMRQRPEISRTAPE